MIYSYWLIISRNPSFSLNSNTNQKVKTFLVPIIYFWMINVICVIDDGSTEIMNYLLIIQFDRLYSM